MIFSPTPPLALDAFGFCFGPFRGQRNYMMKQLWCRTVTGRQIERFLYATTLP